MTGYTARRVAAALIHHIGDLIRVCALLTLVVILAAYIDPASTWKIDAPVWGVVVIAFALLGVERVGLTVYGLGDRLAPARRNDQD